MATTSDTITALIQHRDTLAAHTSDLSAAAGHSLWHAIDDIDAEIDQLTANALATAPYVPQTDPFKSTTDAGKQFIATLNDIKNTFSKLDDVVKAATNVIEIISIL